MANIDKMVSHSRKRVHKVAVLSKKHVKDRLTQFRKRQEAGMGEFWVQHYKEYQTLKSKASMSTHSITNRQP